MLFLPLQPGSLRRRLPESRSAEHSVKPRRKLGKRPRGNDTRRRKKNGARRKKRNDGRRRKKRNDDRRRRRKNSRSGRVNHRKKVGRKKATNPPPMRKNLRQKRKAGAPARAREGTYLYVEDSRTPPRTDRVSGRVWRMTEVRKRGSKQKRRKKLFQQIVKTSRHKEVFNLKETGIFRHPSP